MQYRELATSGERAWPGGCELATAEHESWRTRDWRCRHTPVCATNLTVRV